MILNPLLRRIEGSGKLAMWLRALEAGADMKRQSGASWMDMLKAARGMTSHGEMPLAQAMMAAAAPMMIQRAVVSGDADNGLMATGVVAGRLTDLPTCADLLNQIETDARARLAALLPETGRGTTEGGGGAPAANAARDMGRVPVHHPAGGPPPPLGEE